MLLKLYKIQGSKTIVKLVCLYYNPGIFSDLNLVMKCVHFLVTIKNLQSWLSKQKVTKRPMGCITHLSNNSKYQLYAIIYKMSGQWSKIIRSSTKRFSYFSGLFDFEKSFLRLLHVSIYTESDPTLQIKSPHCGFPSPHHHSLKLIMYYTIYNKVDTKVPGSNPAVAPSCCVLWT